MKNSFPPSPTVWRQKASGLWLRFFSSETEFLQACSNRLLQEIDGLVLAGIPHPELFSKLNLLQQSGLPIVCAFPRTSEEQKIPNIGVDLEKQGWLAGNHLLESGCRRIARFHCNCNRQAGFLLALQEADAICHEELMLRVQGYAYEDGLIAMHALVQSGLEFDAISADSDALASAAVHYLLRAGKPRDAWPKIVGTDDSPIARHCAVPLTSVTSEIRERARTVIRLLFEIGEGRKIESIAISPRLMIRESTQPSLAGVWFRD